MPNRLAAETSPYLLQHRDNPVDWYPWGEEAFQRAQAEDKPVFLSVGYSSCHWCHVMEHESFEDADVAALLNDHFVCVKVDREERPDVDEAYMTAVQITSGRGGWPMSVFMTPDRRPFFAGTYFPKTDRGQHPGMMTLLTQIAQAWRQRRSDLDKAADEISAALRETLGAKPPATFTVLNDALIDQGVGRILSDFDADHGGFGAAPKFPPHSGIELLLGYVLRESAPREMRQAALSASLYTLRQMALGGIHDHVGGGFHRYSTDAGWLLPHFEKMLYDNALLLANFARAAGIAGQVDPQLSQLFQMTAGGIVAWMERELAAPEGFFYSALDADSEGEEGKFYVWTETEVRELLGARADAFMDAYGFRPEGNFEDEATRQLTGHNIPHLQEDVSTQFDEELTILLEARERRVRPGLDDKALVGWNGLAIGALAEAGVTRLAERAALAILRAEETYGRLPHQIAKGQPSGEAFLEDYAHFSDGLLKLATVLIELREMGRVHPDAQTPEFFISHVARLTREMIERFYDEERGAFFSTAESHERLFGRTKPVFDQPIPSANSAAIRVLLAVGDEARARKSLDALVGWMEKAPQATEALYATSLFLIDTAETAAEPEAEAAPAPSPVAAPSALAGQVEVTMSPREIVAGPDGTGHAVVKIRIPEGLHVNSSEPPARWLTPTRVEVRPVKSTVKYPPAENDQYQGELEIPLEIQLPPGKSDAEFEVKVTYQACTNSECLLPAEKTFGAVILR
ncbi:MAG: DUF255 domain-containing protein [Fimbriimonas sp.]